MEKRVEDPVARLLIVDDEEAIRTILKRAMERKGFQCITAGNGVEALEAMAAHEVDVVITDLDMPQMGGLDLVKRVKQGFGADTMVMTGHIDEFSYEQIIELGAVDFILKPMAPGEVVLRVQRVLRERRLFRDLKRTHSELKLSYLDTINRLVTAAEYRDEDTGDHIVRMGTYSAMLAEKAGVDGAWVDRIKYAAAMHDIGKIGIPDKILMKPSGLSAEEFQVIQTHPTIGARILANSKSEVLRTGQQIAISHHEKWDGTGYPQGLSGDRIPLAGRIVGMADVFDALSTKRPYKDPYPPDVVYDIFEKEREKHFDPELTDLFLDNFESFLSVRQKSGGDLCKDGDPFSWSERDQGGSTF